jgi:hypothetical protein
LPDWSDPEVESLLGSDVAGLDSGAVGVADDESLFERQPAKARTARHKDATPRQLNFFIGKNSLNALRADRHRRRLPGWLELPAR